jgi:uncharacterized lipoprotein YbaY
VVASAAICPCWLEAQRIRIHPANQFVWERCAARSHTSSSATEQESEQESRQKESPASRMFNEAQSEPQAWPVIGQVSSRKQALLPTDSRGVVMMSGAEVLFRPSDLFSNEVLYPEMKGHGSQMRVLS